MASIATVVTRGYGSFGSVNLLPTLGYGSASAVSADAQIVRDLPQAVHRFDVQTRKHLDLADAVNRIDTNLN